MQITLKFQFEATEEGNMLWTKDYGFNIKAIMLIPQGNVSEDYGYITLKNAIIKKINSINSIYDKITLVFPYDGQETHLNVDANSNETNVNIDLEIHNLIQYLYNFNYMYKCDFLYDENEVGGFILIVSDKDDLTNVKYKNSINKYYFIQECLDLFDCDDFKLFKLDENDKNNYLNDFQYSLENYEKFSTDIINIDEFL